MDALRHVRLMADYNRWMNDRLYAAADTLPPAQIEADRGAFFGSILGTLNHVAVTDSIWLRRFAAAGHWDCLRDATEWLPDPGSLRQPLAGDLHSLGVLRRRIDDLIVAWANTLIFNDLDRVLAYRNTAGKAFQRQVGPLLSNLFNHQTHHRGQATTLLFQTGIDPGVTDLIAMPGFDPFTDLPPANAEPPGEPAAGERAADDPLSTSRP